MDGDTQKIYTKLSNIEETLDGIRNWMPGEPSLGTIESLLEDIKTELQKLNSK